jgi:hypothetical protein
VEVRHARRGMVKDLGLRGLWTLATGDLGASIAGQAAREITSLKFSRADELEADMKGLDALIGAVRDSHERFTFDVEGRPGAIAAVREALPASEAELLSAILEDVAAELAAYQEALYQVVIAARQR